MVDRERKAYRNWCAYFFYRTIQNNMTPFEQAQKQVRKEELRTPRISNAQGNVDYFGYQLSVHHFNLKIMASGMKFKGVKFTDLKKYYGLEGRTAKDCLPQYEQIMSEYKQSLNNQHA